jgi:5-methylcytosine-specific restriction endonuclease McrA
LLKEESRLRRISWQARLDQIKRMPHTEYLQTREWKARRYQALCRAGNRCQFCGTRNARLEVHQTCYENYGDERPQDLVVLCERCHRRQHGDEQAVS